MKKFNEHKVVTVNAAYEVINNLVEARNQASEDSARYQELGGNDEWYATKAYQSEVECCYYMEILHTLANHSNDELLKEYAQYAIAKLTEE